LLTALARPDKSHRLGTEGWTIMAAPRVTKPLKEDPKAFRNSVNYFQVAMHDLQVMLQKEER